MVAHEHVYATRSGSTHRCVVTHTDVGGDDELDTVVCGALSRNRGEAVALGETVGNVKVELEIWRENAEHGLEHQ